MAHRAERAIPPVAAGVTNAAVGAGSVDGRHINTHHGILPYSHDQLNVRLFPTPSSSPWPISTHAGQRLMRFSPNG